MPTTDIQNISRKTNILQDNNPPSKDYPDDAELLLQSDVRNLAVDGKSVSVGLGENGRRAGAGPFFRRVDLSGTFTSAGVNCVGALTLAGTEFNIGDWVIAGGRSGEYRQVDTIDDATHWTITEAFPFDVTVADDLERLEYGAERLDDLNNKTQNFNSSGKISVGSPAVLSAGWLADGTAYAINEYAITATLGNTFGVIAHGITNAYTNHLVFDIRCVVDASGSDLGGESGLVADQQMTRWNVDDTNITINRAGSSSTVIFNAFVWYKL